ncbi:TSUP family transporter [Paracoccus sulfuroxidans]|uniref:Probable membrane transporter protein n=1 Tax=Paracoccus sulfuroxidans TaxID=384678 RepID=A0A562NSP4_9RHOB|nr:TSUP family transporter [Paracoccus sulfuroxidans]TWI35222.1 sulfite exporter TauE/SafE [Paracoccus sulfuroxidans]
MIDKVMAFASGDMLLLWALVGFAAWLQTLTGFAFGLILMGGVGVFGLIPLPEAAILGSILTILNGGLVIGKEWRQIDRPALRLFLIASPFGLLIGYFALLWLAGTAVTVLQLVLGVVILLASVQLMRRPQVQFRRSDPGSFLVTGLLGGIMGGMFSTGGPPVIWQMYRQPVEIATIRATLLSLFVLNSVMRLGLVLGTTGISASTLTATLGAMPSVAIGTIIAHRLPPPLPPAAMRQMAFGLLFLSGVALSLPALLAILQGR